MKTVFLLVSSLAFSALSCHCATAAPLDSHFEFTDGKPDKLVWQGQSGYSYSLSYSDDLHHSLWALAEGFPKIGSGGPMEYAFTLLGPQGFFRITSELAYPAGFVLIPAPRQFQLWSIMGDQSNPKVGINTELPVHSVYLSKFYIQRTEVTNDQMVEVLNWAYGQGRLVVTANTVKNATSNPLIFIQQELLDLDGGGCRIIWNTATQRFEMKAAKGGAYPCVKVTWYGAAAYCNYRSEMDGLSPCYSLGDWNCNFEANGYRLPTEAEWEKAARGKLVGKNFPQGDTINHSNANYRANGSAYSYDTSPYTDYTFHPDWDEDGQPYISPVGSFAANGHGLYDMAGNVWEWCNDWYGNYPSESQTNPHGPATGLGRVFRGGSWLYYAGNCRVAYRDFNNPTFSSQDYGFRPVRGSAP